MSAQPKPFAHTAGAAPYAAGFLSSIVSARIEGLRGLAALTVALGHSFFLFRDRQAGVWLGSLANGRAAVTVFFVLSGFVLGASLRREKEFTPRVAQTISGGESGGSTRHSLWPLVISWLLVNLLPQAWSRQGAYLVGIIQPITGWRELVANLVFARTTLDNVIWSLRTELVSSCFLLVCIATERRKAALLLALGGLLLGATFAKPQSISITTLIPFWAGYGLPFAIRRLRPYQGAKFAARAALISTGILLVAIPRNLWTLELFATGCESLGGALLILAANLFVDPQKKHASAPAMIVAGRLSYSFYLFHPLVLFWGAATASLHGMGAFFANPGALSLVLVWLITSVPAAAALTFHCKTVEEDSTMVRPKRLQIPKAAMPMG